MLKLCLKVPVGAFILIRFIKTDKFQELEGEKLNEKKLKTLEKERPDEMEVAEKTNEKREEEEKR